MINSLFSVLWGQIWRTKNKLELSCWPVSRGRQPHLCCCSAPGCTPLVMLARPVTEVQHSCGQRQLLQPHLVGCLVHFSSLMPHVMSPPHTPSANNHHVRRPGHQGQLVSWSFVHIALMLVHFMNLQSGWADSGYHSLRGAKLCLNNPCYKLTARWVRSIPQYGQLEKGKKRSFWLLIFAQKNDFKN